MAISMYEACVPVFAARLKALSGVLDAAQQNATERKFDPHIFLTARLAPDMFALTNQVQIATDHAKGAPSRLADATFRSSMTTRLAFQICRLASGARRIIYPRSSRAMLTDRKTGRSNSGWADATCR